MKVPLSEIEFSFARSSGPGGQNVNKVNSKAVLRWCPQTSEALSEEGKARVLEKLGGMLNQEGEIVISSDRYRDQPRNKADCIKILEEKLAQALFVPKKRKKTKPSYSSQKRSEKSKKKHSEKKQGRTSWSARKSRFED